MINDIFLRLRNRHYFKLNLTQARVLYVDDQAIEYCAFGQGPPLVLVMGYASLLNVWHIKFLFRLALDYQIIIFNNRNTGASRAPSPHFTFQDLTMDIRKIIQGLSLKKVVLGGLSMGGMLAQYFASLYPDLVDKLIIINSLPPGWPSSPPSPKVRRLLANIQKLNLFDLITIIKLTLPQKWKAFFMPLYCLIPQQTTLTFPRQTIKQQQDALKTWLNYPAATDILAKIQVPTLILTGGIDKITPPSNWQSATKHIKNCKIVNYPKGGHLMLYQYPESIAEEIKHFIQ